MPRYFISRVHIEGFRGINNEGQPLELAFKTDAVNSVFGTNGLGKSSIYEAICYALRGGIAKLDALHASEKPHTYYCNMFHSVGTATINLTFVPDDGSADVVIEVARDSSGNRKVTSPSGHSAPDDFLKELNSDLALLDYVTFQRFVDDTPLERGRSFASLLGLAQLSEMRQVLQILSNQGNVNRDFKLDFLQLSLNTANSQVTAATTRIKDHYRKLLGKDITGGIDAKGIGEAAGAALGEVSAIKAHFAKTIFDAVDFEKVRQDIRKTEDRSKHERLASVNAGIAKLDKLTAADTDASDQQTLREELENRDTAMAATRGPKFQRLYTLVLEILDSEDWDDPSKCPACESDLQSPLKDSLDLLVQEYATAEACQKKICELWQAGQWVARINSLEAALVKAEERKYAKLNDSFCRQQPTLGDLDTAIALLGNLESLRTARIAELKAEKAMIETELPPSLVALTEQIGHAEQLRTALRDFATAQQNAATVSAKLLRRRDWARFIAQASTQFADAEVALSTRLTSDIEAQYKATYEQITNNPNIVPALKKASGSEELHLTLERFYTLANLSAATLLPESYKNALAIAIFLSAALKARPTSRFIVLDDVTSSFDSGHQFALMELLRSKIAHPANTDGPQIIILSHDGLLEKYFDTLSNTAGWHHQKLSGSPPDGAVLSQAQQANRLRGLAEQLLKAGQTDQAAPLVRQYLEFKLLEVIRRVNIPVPIDFSIRDDRKMVDNSMKAIREALELHQQASTLAIPGPVLNDILTVHAPSIVANWINHYSTGVATSITPYVLLGVLTTIDDLSDCFKHPCTCGGPNPRFYKSLASKHCSCV
jgi:hypothetical protein